MQGKDEEKPYENFICGGRAGSSGNYDKAAQGGWIRSGPKVNGTIQW